MQLDDITLNNFQIYAGKRAFKFSKGVNGIVGINGAGKSTIIRAIRFLFTGTVDGNKDDYITRGYTNGSVSSHFTHDGKQGYIERHLDCSKVKLVYNGKTITKSTEVKELWNDLLQIDETIFNNVIIAGQGEIADLFSGSDTVREKIFQKIFLVPNTERLRNIIWENYVKTCPSEHPVEDVSLLRSQMTEIVQKLNPVRKQIDEILSKTLNELTVAGVMSRVNFLKRCINDQKLKPKLQEDIDQLSQKITGSQNQLGHLEGALNDVDINETRKSYEEMLISKQKFKTKQSLTLRLDDIKSQIELSEEELTAIDKQVENLGKQVKEQSEKVAILKADKSRIEALVTKLSQLCGQKHCPTCNQALFEVEEFLDKQEEEIETLSKQLSEHETKLSENTREHLRLTKQATGTKVQWTEVKRLESELATYADVTFSEADLQLLAAGIKAHEEMKDIVAELKTKLAQLQGQKALYENQLATLATYDGSASPEEELGMMEQVLELNHTRKDLTNELKLQETKWQTEISLLEQRINVSLANTKKNEKRKQYLDKLMTVYDVLHVSRFPRQLIQSYSEDVQEYLLTNIENFNIPYKPRIVEGFKVQMINEDGHIIPELSGGQKVIVGLCLRLALHSLFAQSFPMWIIDEGTTHLDQENVRLYFNLIRRLKTEGTIQQVIIIDHHNALTDVVDNVIQI